MATTITNKTREPISVRLSRGKKLFLGPGKSGEISSSDVDRPAVKALLDEGTLEVTERRGHSIEGGGESKRRASRGFASGGGPSRSGDR